MVHKLKEPYITIVHCVKCQTVSHLQLFKETKEHTKYRMMLVYIRHPKNLTLEKKLILPLNVES